MTPYLPTVTILGIMEAEAGNRAQPEVKQEDHTGANGEMAWIKQVLEKCLSVKLQPEKQNADYILLFSQHHADNSCNL
ncbi:hypothetical protein NIES37_70780 (plasmid) [Tolypothrix tenuis PCC 7101]|uniref:Uncharacterized protein n=1 Tax=Tolypothrix tenuis PCC 7101 TaxID=231146 RepID=A0A1Z4N8P8_9CYAN|nr:hypothetical protein NIES37_61110 [Tolypothrix tenuis PCC 7101]BAZ03065.1 hypothetical protein NIES37_70780 [Tolypothrix tenuis PCC 7101]BAZ78197.1 hypothetical protein NIES50_68300 [Aulosira laxa NIES-50]